MRFICVFSVAPCNSLLHAIYFAEKRTPNLPRKKLLEKLFGIQRQIFIYFFFIKLNEMDRWKIGLKMWIRETFLCTFFLLKISVENT